MTNNDNNLFYKKSQQTWTADFKLSMY